MTEIGWSTDLTKLKPEEITEWIETHRRESAEIDSPLYSLHQTLLGYLMWGNVPEEHRGWSLPKTLAELREMKRK